MYDCLLLGWLSLVARRRETSGWKCTLAGVCDLLSFHVFLFLQLASTFLSRVRARMHTY